MKSIVLMSGGLDSLVSIAQAKTQTDVLLALFFDYSQKSVKGEKAASQAIAAHYNVPLKTIKLDWLGEITKTALVDKSKDVPAISVEDIDRKLEIKSDSARAVWVPNRNGVFINIAASFAESLGADHIIAGFNSEEAATFPDNSIQFINSANQALLLSTFTKPKVISYIQSYNKTGIVNMGIKLKVPFELTYSCYNTVPSGKMCGKCESCSRTRRAFKKTGYYDLIKERFDDEEEVAK